MANDLSTRVPLSPNGYFSSDPNIFRVGGLSIFLPRPYELLREYQANLQAASEA